MNEYFFGLFFFLFLWTPNNIVNIIMLVLFKRIYALDVPICKNNISLYAFPSAPKASKGACLQGI